MRIMDDRIVGYRCRRGLLELDQILVPFFECYYKNLSEGEKKLFVDLLECSDPELQSWFFSQKVKPKIVAIILRKMQQSSASTL